MKRPFAVLGFSVYAALFCAAWAGPSGAGVLFCACVGAGCTMAAVGTVVRFLPVPRALRVRAPSFVLPCFCMALALALYLNAWHTQVQPVQCLDGQKAQVQALLLDYPEERYHRYYYRLQVKQIDGQAVKPFTLRLSAAQPLRADPYDLVTCPVGFFSFEGGGPYSQQNLRLAGGYQLGAYLAGSGGSRAPSAGFPVRRLLAELRRQAGRVFSQLLPPEDAALLQAMLIGRRDGLPEESYSDFQLLGCSHLLVISGLHMGLLSAAVSRLARILRLPRPLRCLLVGLSLLVFLCMSGFPVSAVRACVMHVVYLLADLLGERADSVNSLGFALFLICLYDPFSGGDLGLALSAFATLGILTLAGRLTSRLLSPLKAHPTAQRLLRPAAASLSMTLSATAFTLPWQMAAFGQLPLLAPLANLVLGPACTLLLYGAFLLEGLTVLPLLAPLVEPVALCTGWVSRFIRWAAQKLATLPGISLHLDPVGMGAACVLLLMLSLWLLLGFRPRGAQAATLLLTALVLWASLFSALSPTDLLTVAVAGDGEGLTVLLIKNRQAAVLSLGSLENQGLKLLLRHNVRRVDTLFFPVSRRPQRDSAALILRQFQTDRVLLPAGSYSGRELAGQMVEELSPGQAFSTLGLTIYWEEDRLSFFTGGTRFMVELSPSGPGACTVLITKDCETQVNSAFTVLPADGIIEEGYARPGACLLPGGGESLSLTVGPQGLVSIKEGD